MDKKEEFTDELSALGKRLRAIRRKRELKLSEMGERIGLSKSYLSDIELGKKNPGAEFFLKIAKKFNVSMDYLFLGVGEMFLKGEEKSGGSEAYDFKGDLDTVGKFVWLMENSPFFESTMMGHASRLLLHDEETIKASVEKQQSLKRAAPGKK